MPQQHDSQNDWIFRFFLVLFSPLLLHPFVKNRLASLSECAIKLLTALKFYLEKFLFSTFHVRPPQHSYATFCAILVSPVFFQFSNFIYEMTQAYLRTSNLSTHGDTNLMLIAIDRITNATFNINNNFYVISD